MFSSNKITKDENYDPQVLLEECNEIEKKKKKMIRDIIDNLESSYDDSDEE